MGLDEDAHRLRVLDGTDPASWWAQVAARFAGDVAPDPTFVAVSVESGAVMAIGFDTDRSPYVVNTQGKDGVVREVPWRSGTSIRTAHRRELLQMLLPVASVPQLELVDASVRANEMVASRGPDVYGNMDPEFEEGEVSVAASCSLFIEASETVMLPKHRWQGLVSFGGGSAPQAELELSFSPLVRFRGTGFAADDPHPRGVVVNLSGLYVNGAGMLTMHATGRLLSSSVEDVMVSGAVTLQVRLPLSGAVGLSAVAHETLTQLTGMASPRPSDASTVRRHLGSWGSPGS